MANDISRITLYLTIEERAKLEHLAQQEKRTISNWVAYWTERRYKELFGDAPPPPLREINPGKKKRRSI